MGFVTYRDLERCGRLGNQLFQMASTIGIARRHGGEPRFPTSWSYRPYFCVPDELFDDEAHGGVESSGFAPHLDPRTVRYLQDYSLFEDVADEVRTYFAPSELARSELDRYPLPEGPVHVIHVRRGDNVYQPDHYPLPSLTYYLGGVSDRPVCVFTDDPTWCDMVLRASLSMAYIHWGTPRSKEHEADYYQAPCLDWIDLLLMARCGPAASFTISNSSYAWWGAWLSGSDDVTYPEPFLGRLLDIRLEGYCDTSLMMPANWKARSSA